MTRRRWWIVLGLVVAVGAALALYRHFGWAPAKVSATRLTVDLARPDALLRTANLAQLPRDVLRVPVLRDVLTEDFVYYYQGHEDRLGLEGTVRRIAYEHQLDWSDRLVAAMLDAPAEVALWRDGKGALRHFAVVMQRNTLAKLAQEAATVALKDTQLTKAAELGSGTPVYALALNPRRTLLLVARGDRLAILSDPGLLLDAEGKVVRPAQAALAKWLDADGALGAPFDLGAPGAPAKTTHTLALGASAMTLGYAPFVPGLAGVRFDFGGDAWSMAMLVDPARLPRQGLADRELWRAVPANAAACVLLPLDFQAAAKVVSEARSGPSGADARALAALEGSAVACWYREASLYAPLFIARTASAVPDRDKALQALATWAIRPSKATAVAEDDLADTPSFSPAADANRPARTPDGALIWRAPERKESDLPERLERAIGTATVGAKDAYVFFSPDARLVELALDTLAAKHPSAADQIDTAAPTLGLVTPRTLAEMAQREAIGALGRPGDDRLQQAARTLLPPRMKALAQYPPYQVVLSGERQSGAAWRPIEWRSVEKR